MDTSSQNILLLGLLQFLLYWIFNLPILKKKKWNFPLLFTLATFLSIIFRWNDIQILQGKTSADIRLLAVLGSLFIVLVFNVYYNIILL